MAIIVTFMFHSFYRFPSKVEVLTIFKKMFFQFSGLCIIILLHISFSWWLSTRVWVTASFLTSIPTMLLCGQSPQVPLLFPSLQVLLPIFWRMYQENELQLVWSSLSGSTVCQFPKKVVVLITFFTFFKFYSVLDSASYLFFVDYCKVWSRWGDRFVSQNLRWVCASHSAGQILGCSYTICSYGQISISRTIPWGLPSQPIRSKSYTLSLLIFCIRLLCDWSFSLYHHITYIYCFVVSYLFSLW